MRGQKQQRILLALFMSFPAELPEGFSNLSSSRMFLYPRRASSRAVDDPIVPPPPTINIPLLKSTIPNPSIRYVWMKK